MEELVDLELKKHEYEQHIENSFVEIKKMSELLRRDKITEDKQIYAEQKLDNNTGHLKYKKAENYKIAHNLLSLKNIDCIQNPPNLDWSKATIPLRDTQNNGRKVKKKPNVTT